MQFNSGRNIQTTAYCVGRPVSIVRPADLVRLSYYGVTHPHGPKVRTSPHSRRFPKSYGRRVEPDESSAELHYEMQSNVQAFGFAAGPWNRSSMNRSPTPE